MWRSAIRFGPGVDEDFSQLEEWGDGSEIQVVPFPREGEKAVRSNALSGGERNRLFLRNGDNYKDVSLVSGVDFREDGRGFVVFDYDRDGWLDLGISSPNAPRFRIARNRLADFQETRNSFVEIKLVGGQTSTTPSSEWSSRDAFGARVKVTTGEQTRMFQLSCGEGLSIQNSRQIHVGMGQTSKIDKVEVLWPSGKTSVKQDIATGERITIFENPASDKQVH